MSTREVPHDGSDARLEKPADEGGGAGAPPESVRGLANPLVRLARSVERAAVLDPVARVIRPAASAVVSTHVARTALRGRWLGHAAHPMLTDFPLGLWMSGTLLDLVGGVESRRGARTLVGLGVLTALPTALTGVAEWSAVETPRDRRTGLVHAGVNTVALALYASSWRARVRGRDGVALAVAGGLTATVGGFFGGHLTEVRKVSSVHPAFDQG